MLGRVLAADAAGGPACSARVSSAAPQRLSLVIDGARRPGRSTLTWRTPAWRHSSLMASGWVAPVTTRCSTCQVISVRTVSTSSAASRSVETTTGHRPRARASRSKACDMVPKKRSSWVGIIMPIRPERWRRRPLAWRLTANPSSPASCCTRAAVSALMRRCCQLPLRMALTVEAEVPARSARS
ncbi:MAG: hypothetical protein RL223_4646 [Pseudomonadota bacterium]